MAPQDSADLIRQLAAIRARHLQWIAHQDPTLTQLKQVLEEERAIRQMDIQGVRDLCATLEAKYAKDNGRDT